MSAQAVAQAQEPRQARTLRQRWALGQRRLPGMLVMGHMPAVRSGHARMLGRLQP